MDRVHDLVEGRLDAEGAAALAAAAAADPDLAALLEAYRDVHTATSGAEVEPPPCRVTFADVERRIDRTIDWTGPAGLLRRLPVRLAAAAVLVAGVGLAWSAAHTSVGPAEPVIDPVVHLTAIPAEHQVLAETGIEDMASTLAAFRPVVDGQPGWLSDFDGGLAIARATGRPVLLFIYHPTCPACVQLRSDSFPDEEVLGLLGEFVPVHVDITVASEKVGSLTQQGWPFLGAFAPDGTQLAAFPGFLSSEQLQTNLRDAVEKAELGGAVPWTRARALAARLDVGVAAFDGGELGKAYREYAALVTDDADGAFGAAASRGMIAIGAAARVSLMEARELSTEAAAARLDDDAARFADTPFAADLSAVREALRTSGRFPQLDPPLSEGR